MRMIKWVLVLGAVFCGSFSLTVVACLVEREVVITVGEAKPAWNNPRRYSNGPMPTLIRDTSGVWYENRTSLQHWHSVIRKGRPFDSGRSYRVRIRGINWPLVSHRPVICEVVATAD